MYFFNSLKTNIAANLAILLVIAMLFIDFVMVITAQRNFIRSELSKGRLFSSLINKNMEISARGLHPSLKGDFTKDLPELIHEFGISRIVILDKSGKQLFSANPDKGNFPEIEKMARTAMKAGKESVHYTGSTWGVFWKKSLNLIFSVPVDIDNRSAGGIGFVMPLDGFYKELRNSQEIVLFYIFFNTLILTFIGFLRLHRLSIRPIHRLVKRAEEYSDKNGFVFKHEKEKNEFGMLQGALNRMLSRISDDREILRTSLDSLEKSNVELKKAHNEIIRAEKLASVGRLSAGIAHEIGNPIGIVLGYLELLKQDALTEEERNDYTGRAEKEITRINSIIRQLLDFSRPGVEKTENISVHDILNEVTDILSVQPLMSKIGISTSFQADQDTIYGDGSRLRQIFLNLMINAGDAISSGETKDNGRIEIKTSVMTNAGKPSNKIEFTDNGPGILPENLENIFDPFYTTKEPGKGTGLGLAVSFMIVEQMGGSIRAGRTGTTGTTMEVCLPLSEKK